MCIINSTTYYWHGKLFACLLCLARRWYVPMLFLRSNLTFICSFIINSNSYCESRNVVCWNMWWYYRLFIKNSATYYQVGYFSANLLYLPIRGYVQTDFLKAICSRMSCWCTISLFVYYKLHLLLDTQLFPRQLTIFNETHEYFFVYFL